MNTSIQVDMETKVILDGLKKAYKARSYDETIIKLIRTKTSSFYGALARKNKVPMKEILHNLRDKDDRA